MSTVMEPIRVGVGRPTQQSDNARRLAMASEVRWVCQPFKDISFMEPTGRGVKNSIEPEIGEEGELIFCGIRRCIPYPLVNHEYNVLPHEQEGNDLPPSYGGEAPGARIEPQPIKAPKYALDCANELTFKYGAEYGLLVLEPLTGILDENLVQLVFSIAQPYAYKLHNIEQELKDGFELRLAGSDLPTQVKNLARAIQPILLKGAQRAINTARNDYGEYYKDTQSFVGSKKGRSYPLDYDRYVADQLGLELPTVVQAVPQPQGADNKVLELLEKLTDSATQKDDGSQAMAERLAAIEAEREADRETNRQLMARLEELAANQARPRGRQPRTEGGRE